MRWLVIMSNTDHHSFAGRGGDRGGGGDDGYRRFIDPPDSLSQFQTMSSSTALDSTGLTGQEREREKNKVRQIKPVMATLWATL